MKWARKPGFSGGLYLPAEKDRTADRPIELLALPPRLQIPLRSCAGRPAVPAVTPGQAVRCGEIVGRGPGADCVHASADGTVRAISTCDTPHEVEVPCVDIEAARARVPHVASAGRAATIDELIAHAASAGIVETDSLTGIGRSLSARLLRARDARCEHVLVNGVESEPCLTAEWRLLVERTQDVIAGAERLGRLLNAADIVLAVDAARRKWVAALASTAAASRVRVLPLENKYPAGHPALLVKALLHREIPYGGDDVDAGVFVVQVATVVAVESSLRSGMPITQRLVTVTGDAAARPGNYLIAIGTPIRHVLEHVGLSHPPSVIIVGNPMTGVAIRNLETIVARCTTGILLLTDSGPVERGIPDLPTRCNRCGGCIDGCPVGLDPIALLSAAERRAVRRAADLRVHACIGCGICSYTCPARLPLAASIRALQAEVPRPAPTGARSASSAPAATEAVR